MTELSLPLIIFPLFFLVAFVYSSVGHGGASGYLALFALFGIVSPSVAPIALTLNIVVATISWWRYRKSGYFSWSLLLPFVIGSIPAAFVGGLIRLPQQTFSLLLGLCLFWAAFRLAFIAEIKVEVTAQREAVDQRRKHWAWGVPLGGALGLLSGLVGIGGGIFLSPLLLLLRWADAKRTAAVSSAFIVLNSLSGLAAHFSRSNMKILDALPLALVVLVGGFVGSSTGALRLRPRTLQIVLAIVLVLAGVKLVGKIL